MATIKTAVSLEQELFKWVEASAKKKNLSRSGFFAEALEAYRREQEDEALVAALDAAYADGLDDEEKAWLEASARSFAEIADEWK